GVYAVCWLLLWLVMIVQAPIMLIMFANINFDNPDVSTHAIELALHGKGVVVFLHAITAMISAPVVAALFMVQTVVFLSFYWWLVVLLLMLVFRALQYSIEQVAAGSQGPVLAVAALLVAVSAALKIFL